jgi:hypothetical protein
MFLSEIMKLFILCQLGVLGLCSADGLSCNATTFTHPVVDLEYEVHRAAIYDASSTRLTWVTCTEFLTPDCSRYL